MTLFKVCTFIIFYFVVRLAFTPSAGSLANSYDEESRKVTDAHVAMISE